MFRQSLETSDGQVKLIQTRINMVETYFANISTVYGTYCRKLGRLRDAGDDLSNALQQYAGAETLNRSLRSGLSHFADCLTAIEDYRQTMIERLDAKVVGQLVPYETTCKAAKKNLKIMLKARAQQLESKKFLQKARDRAPLNRQKISMAESELTKATVEAGQTLRQLEDMMDSFEQKKSQDIKKILLDHITAELLFHSRAIEIYTKAYNFIKTIDDDEDLHEFRDQLKLSPTGAGQLDLTHNLESGSSSSRRVPNLSTPGGSSMSSLVGRLQVLQHQQNGASSESEENAEEEEEDYDDDDDDEEDEDDIDVEDIEDTHLQGSSITVTPFQKKRK